MTNITKLIRSTKYALLLNSGGSGACPVMIWEIAEAVRVFRQKEGLDTQIEMELK